MSSLSTGVPSSFFSGEVPNARGARMTLVTSALHANAAFGV